MPSRRAVLCACASIALLPRHALAEVRTVRGSAFVNGRLADAATRIRASDRIVVSHGGLLEFSIGEDAYRVGGGSALELDDAGGGVVGALRLLTGALLGVFGRREQDTRIITQAATIGIRGTGVFVDARPGRIYTCTCYGSTTLAAAGEVQRFTATHHDAHQVDFDASGAMTMRAAEVLGHDDDQLRRLEGYVGRIPAFDR